MHITKPTFSCFRTKITKDSFARLSNYAGFESNPFCSNGKYIATRDIDSQFDIVLFEKLFSEGEFLKEDSDVFVSFRLENHSDIIHIPEICVDIASKLRLPLNVSYTIL